MHDEQLITAKELASLLKVKLNTVRMWYKCGKLPPPYRLSNRTLRWRLSDVLEWVEKTKPPSAATEGND